MTNELEELLKLPKYAPPDDPTIITLDRLAVKIFDSLPKVDQDVFIAKFLLEEPELLNCLLSEFVYEHTGSLPRYE